MKQTRILMDMHVTVEIVDRVTSSVFDEIYDYFSYIDDTFSTFKKTSEITKINEGTLTPKQYSNDMADVLALCEQTKKESDGFFDIHRNGKLDPSGLVKGWAINNAATMLKQKGLTNYYVDAGGDIQVSGHNEKGKPWTIGIRNPFNVKEIVKVLRITSEGVATSGIYERGNHVYNPKNHKPVTDIVSLTVIGPNVYESDRFATAAFAMGPAGITFIDRMNNFEGYMIDKNGMATYTQGFEKFVA